MQNLMPEITTPDKRFHDGNPLTGVEGTIVPSLWLNDVQNSVRNAQLEIINTLKAAGLTVDDSNNEQLNQAIKLLIAKELPTASTTKSGIVQLSSSLTSTSETLAATAKAIKTVNDVAKTALQQQQNGADIPDKELFLQNLQIDSWKNGRLLSVKQFAASATYTPSAGTKFIIVELVAGGGGGGGASITSVGQVSVGGGGAAGGYVQVVIQNPKSANVTIGAGGAAGGGQSGNSAGVGGASAFGSFVSVSGGAPGSCVTGGTPAFAINGANQPQFLGGSGGDILFTAVGGSGNGGFVSSIGGNALGGCGGSSIFGCGGGQQGSGLTGLTSPSYGGGGGGACTATQNYPTPSLGGRGGAGFCLVWEYA